MNTMPNRHLYDLHCHCLPGIDDGCKTKEESAQVLRQSLKQGVAAIVATPHYYPKETVSSFLDRRNRSYMMLCRFLKDNHIAHPNLFLGAEVAYHTGLVNEKQLNQLCIGQSKYLLLEMPFSKWSPNVLREVQAMRRTRGIIPIIAHIERYLKIQEKHTIETLIYSDVMIQMNAEYILDFWTQRKAKKMLNNGWIQFLGTDSHNLTSRPPNLGQAVHKLEQWKMTDCLDDICTASKNVLARVSVPV